MSSDTGFLQINKKYHLEEAIKLGLDIDTLEGNLKMGKVLFDRNHLSDWNASKDCWSSLEYAPSL